jgi:hypothetical protein
LDAVVAPPTTYDFGFLRTTSSGGGRFKLRVSHEVAVEVALPDGQSHWFLQLVGPVSRLSVSLNQFFPHSENRTHGTAGSKLIKRFRVWNGTRGGKQRKRSHCPSWETSPSAQVVTSEGERRNRDTCLEDTNLYKQQHRHEQQIVLRLASRKLSSKGPELGGAV